MWRFCNTDGFHPVMSCILNFSLDFLYPEFQKSGHEFSILGRPEGCTQGIISHHPSVGFGRRSLGIFVLDDVAKKSPTNVIHRLISPHPREIIQTPCVGIWCSNTNCALGWTSCSPPSNSTTAPSQTFGARDHLGSKMRVIGPLLMRLLFQAKCWAESIALVMALLVGYCFWFVFFFWFQTVGCVRNDFVPEITGIMSFCATMGRSSVRLIRSFAGFSRGF